MKESEKVRCPWIAGMPADARILLMLEGLCQGSNLGMYSRCGLSYGKNHMSPNSLGMCFACVGLRYVGLARRHNFVVFMSACCNRGVAGWPLCVFLCVACAILRCGGALFRKMIPILTVGAWFSLTL